MSEPGPPSSEQCGVLQFRGPIEHTHIDLTTLLDHALTHSTVTMTTLIDRNGAPGQQ